MAVAMLGTAPPAVALVAPSASTDRSDPSFSASWTFSWSAVAPDLGGAITYQGGLTSTPLGEPADDLGAGASVTLQPAPGTQYFRVRAVEQGALLPGPYSDAITVTRATITGSRSPGANARGWANAPVTVSFSCTPGIPSCTAPRTLGEGVWPDVTGTGTDADGVSAGATIGGPKVDLTPPVSGAPDSPRDGEVSTSRRPAFQWVPGSDALSGIQFYEVWLESPQVKKLGSTNPGVTRLTPSSDLPLGTIRWFVKTYDNAFGSSVPGGPSNGSRSASFGLTIDPSAPAAPTVLAGPAGPTNDPTPTFGWSGAGPRFDWVVTRPGVAVPVAQGTTADRQARVSPPLPDGAYTFRVKQVRGGQDGPQATRDFVVDTVAPGAPVIVTRPPARSTLASPVFGWRGAEPGGSYTWRVGAVPGGRVEKGPSDNTATQVAAGPLGPGSYIFEVRQVDAAGNAGPWSAPAAFGVRGGSGALAGRPEGGRFRPLVRNAGNLSPRAGSRLRVLRPVLRWKGRPWQGVLYNVQVLAVRGARVQKVLSAFARGTRLQVPRNVLRRGTRYVWRVWPYLGRNGYSRAPIGISYFDIGPRPGRR